MKQLLTGSIFLAFLAIPPSLAAGALGEVNLRGYVRETALFWEVPAYLSETGSDEQQFTNLLHTRQNLRWYTPTNVSVGLEIKTRLFSGDAVQDMLAQTELLGGNQTLFDWDYRFIDKNNSLLVSTIDRAWVDYYTGNLQVTVGRQRIAWGSTFVWNPTDIFNPSSPLDFDNEEKPGTDGIRMQHYLGANSKFELAFASTDLEDSNAMTFAGRIGVNAHDFDWNLLLGSKRQNTLLGGGFEGDILGGGFRGEALYTIRNSNPGRLSPPSDGSGGESSLSVNQDYLRFSFDGDYTFRNSLYLHAGVRYNELGATEDAGSISNQYRSIVNEWLSPARWSLFGQVGGNASPLMRADLMAILNPLDLSWYAGPSASYSVITNLDLTCTALVFIGGEGTEFGAQGTIYMVRLKYSF